MYASPLNRLKNDRRQNNFQQNNRKNKINVNIQERTAENFQARFDKYFYEVGIEDNFNHLTAQLLSKDTLPYNPYPWLMRQIWTISERQNALKKCSGDKLVNKDRTNFVHSSIVNSLVHTAGCDFVWGLEHIVRTVNIEQIWKYLWLFEDISTMQHNVSTNFTGYNVQIIPAIIGETVFHGSFFKSFSKFEVRMECIVAGSDEQQAIDIFIDWIFLDVNAMESKSLHFLLDVCVPVFDNGCWNVKKLKYEELVMEKKDWHDAMKKAIMNSKMITIETLFSLDPHRSSFISGRIEYIMDFVYVSNNVKEDDRIVHFTESPFATLFDGIFLCQTHAESYVSLYLRNVRQDLDEKDETNILKSDENDQKYQDSKLRHGKQHSSLNKGNELDSMGELTGNDIDGFKIIEEHNQNALIAAQNKIKMNWKSRLACYDLTSDLWQIVHFMILLELSESNIQTNEILTELTILTHSQAAQLYSLMHFNGIVRELLYKYNLSLLQDTPVQILKALLCVYEERMSDFFNIQRPEYTSMCTDDGFSRRVLHRLRNILHPNQSVNSTLTMETLSSLKDLYAYLYTFYLLLADNVMNCCPNLQNSFEAIKKQFQTESTSPNGEESRFQIKLKETTDDLRNEQFQHGLEDVIGISKQNDMGINLSICQQKLLSQPYVIEKQECLVQYISDTRLDEVLEEFIEGLCCEDSFPDSCQVYFRLNDLLQRFSMRLELSSHNHNKMNSQIPPSPEIIPIGENKMAVKTMQQYNVFGLSSVLSISNFSALENFIKKVEQFFQIDFPLQDGPYKVAMTTALGGNTAMFGKFDPYLTDVELHEHCFIHGPKGCQVEAIQLYIRIIHEDLLLRFKANNVLIGGLYITVEDQERTELSWNIYEIIHKRKGFSMMLEQSIVEKKNIALKFFIEDDWRMVRVIKRLLFHYVSDGNKLSTKFFKMTGCNAYQNIFLDPERAMFYFKYGGPSEELNPFHQHNISNVLNKLDQHIVNSIASSDWLIISRLIFWRSCIIQNQDSSILVEVRKMMHSIARRLDYVVELGRTIRDLIQCVIAREEHEEKRENKEKFELDDDVGQQDPSMDPEKLEICITKMMTSFKQKLFSVCSEQSSRAPQRLIDSLVAKVESLTYVDEQTGQTMLEDLDLTMILRLDEAIEMTSSLRDMNSSLVYRCCQSMQEMTQRLIVKTSEDQKCSLLETRSRNNIYKARD